MMKKFDWNKAITWKDYAKLCGISFIAGMAVIGISMIKLNADCKKLETSENKTEE